jgi:hypothetical protein
VRLNHLPLAVQPWAGSTTFAGLPVENSTRSPPPTALFLMRGGITVAIAGMALALWLFSTSTRGTLHSCRRGVRGLSIYWLNLKLNRELRHER